MASGNIKMDRVSWDRRRKKVVRGYEVIREIGRGSYGTVYLVRKDSKEFAMKEVSLKHLEGKDVEYCLQEAETMKRYRHPNLVTLHEFFQIELKLYIVMEYCEGGSLKEYLQREHKDLDEEEIIYFMIQMCKPLKYLHRKNVIHRDVKTANIFMTNDRQLKLGDMALTRECMANFACTALAGTQKYMSPEIIEGREKYDQKADVWSLGCCFYELSCRECLFSQATSLEALKGMVRLSKSTRVLINLCDKMNSLFKDMISYEPKDRPPVDEILQRLEAHANYMWKNGPAELSPGASAVSRSSSGFAKCSETSRTSSKYSGVSESSGFSVSPRRFYRSTGFSVSSLSSGRYQGITSDETSDIDTDIESDIEVSQEELLERERQKIREEERRKLEEDTLRWQQQQESFRQQQAHHQQEEERIAREKATLEQQRHHGNHFTPHQHSPTSSTVYYPHKALPSALDPEHRKSKKAPPPTAPKPKARLTTEDLLMMNRKPTSVRKRPEGMDENASKSEPNASHRDPPTTAELHSLNAVPKPELNSSGNWIKEEDPVYEKPFVIGKRSDLIRTTDSSNPQDHCVVREAERHRISEQNNHRDYDGVTARAGPTKPNQSTLIDRFRGDVEPRPRPNIYSMSAIPSSDSRLSLTQSRPLSSSFDKSSDKNMLHFSAKTSPDSYSNPSFSQTLPTNFSFNANLAPSRDVAVTSSRVPGAPSGDAEPVIAVSGKQKCSHCGEELAVETMCTWQKALDSKNEDVMMKLIQADIMPGASDLQRAFQLYREFSITDVAIDTICGELCQHIKGSSDKIRSVYPSYTAEKPKHMVFIVMADKAVQIDTSYDIIVCHPEGYSEEGSYITYHDIRREKRITQEESDGIAATIQSHATRLFDRHSNIQMISGCSVKSKGFGTEHSTIERQTCVVIYVSVKGKIPLHETSFPVELGEPSTGKVFPVDVREGGFQFFGGPRDYHQNLKMGCQVTDLKSEGTLGAVIEKGGGTCCLTCAHVFFENPQFLTALANHGSYDKAENDRTGDIRVYQSDHTNHFGVVAHAAFFTGNNQNAGIDIAVINITDQSRTPVEGSFPDGNMETSGFTASTPMIYTNGKVFDQSHFKKHVVKYGSEVVKYGSETEYTKGLFDMQGLCAKRIDYTDQYLTRNIVLNNQLVVLSAGDPDINPFAKQGDSGALVFGKHGGNWSDLRVVGIIEGGASNKTVAVTPIWDVLTYLGINPQSGLKEFATPLLPSDSGFISPIGSPSVSENSPGSIEDVRDQARSQEIAEHFHNLEERMNTKFELMQRDQQQHIKQLELMQRDQQQHIKQLEDKIDNMQKEILDKLNRP